MLKPNEFLTSCQTRSIVGQSQSSLRVYIFSLQYVCTYMYYLVLIFHNCKHSLQNWNYYSY